MISAESLVEFAGGRGIDLVGAAESAIRVDGLAPRRRRTFQERLEGLPIVESAHGKQSRSMKKPGWTAHDLGHALAGCPKMPDLAAWFAYGRDDKNFAQLFRGLLSVALSAAERDNWPKALAFGEIPYHYLPMLTNLVFEADRHAHIYQRRPDLYAARMDVTLDVWCARLEGRYLYLRGRYEGWLDEALSYISGSLNGRHVPKSRNLRSPVDKRRVAH